MQTHIIIKEEESDPLFESNTCFPGANDYTKQLNKGALKSLVNGKNRDSLSVGARPVPTPRISIRAGIQTSRNWKWGNNLVFFFNYIISMILVFAINVVEIIIS